MRRGSVTEQYLKVPLKGKKEPVKRGPYYVYSCKVKGRTCSRRVRGREMDRLRREVENFHRFQELSQELIEVSEKICDMRAAGGAAPEGKKNSRRR